MPVRWKLVGRILVALAGSALAGAGLVPDTTVGSPRAVLMLVAGILGAVGTVLVLYGDPSDASST